MSPPADRARHDHRGVGRQQDALGRDQLDVQGHAFFSSSRALARAESASPTLRKACSGRSSSSPFDQLSEGLDRGLGVDPDAVHAGEHLAHEERLRQEPLHLAGPVHGDAVLLGELVETEDGDDVLQLLVALQHLLHPAGHVVVALAHDLGREDGRGRRQRVDRRVDAERRDLAGRARWWRRGG